MPAWWIKGVNMLTPGAQLLLCMCVCASVSVSLWEGESFTTLPQARIDMCMRVSMWYNRLKHPVTYSIQFQDKNTNPLCTIDFGRSYQLLFHFNAPGFVFSCMRSAGSSQKLISLWWKWSNVVQDQTYLRSRIWSETTNSFLFVAYKTSPEHVQCACICLRRADLVKKPVRSTAGAVNTKPHFSQRGDVIDLHVESVFLTTLKPAVHHEQRRV